VGLIDLIEEEEDLIDLIEEEMKESLDQDQDHQIMLGNLQMKCKRIKI
jgi:hypothetical protein